MPPLKPISYAAQRYLRPPETSEGHLPHVFARFDYYSGNARVAHVHTKPRGRITIHDQDAIGELTATIGASQIHPPKPLILPEQQFGKISDFEVIDRRNPNTTSFAPNGYLAFFAAAQKRPEKVGSLHFCFVAPTTGSPQGKIALTKRTFLVLFLLSEGKMTLKQINQRRQELAKEDWFQELFDQCDGSRSLENEIIALDIAKVRHEFPWTKEIIVSPGKGAHTEKGTYSLVPDKARSGIYFYNTDGSFIKPSTSS